MSRVAYRWFVCLQFMLQFSGAAAQERPQLVVQRGHTDHVKAVTFSPDGKTALSGSDDRTLRLWDVASGRELKTLSGHTGSVTSVAFSPDGKTALSASVDKTLRLWEVVSGRELKTLSGHTDRVNSVAFSPDGKTALSGSDDKTLRLWEVASGRELKTLSGHTGRVTSVAFSSDGKTALSGSGDDTVRLWAVGKGRELKTLSGHTSLVTSVAFSPDGKTALSGSWDTTVRMWDVVSGRELKTFSGQRGWVICVTFSPDGKNALSGTASGYDELRLWDVGSARELKTLNGHTGGVTSLAFSPDGKTALSGSLDKTIRLWDVASGLELKALGGRTTSVSSVAFSADGKTALSGSDDKTLRLWDLASGQQLRIRFAHAGKALQVVFSPVGKTALSGGDDKTLRLWDVTSGRELWNGFGHRSTVSSVVFSPDAKTAAAGSWDGTVSLWDMVSGRAMKPLSGHTSLVTSVAFSPDGQTVLSGSSDNTLRLWDVASARELKSLNGHTNGVTSVAFSPDGKTALSGSWDTTLRIWDVFSGRELRTLIGHTNGVTSVAFSPDGKTALSGSWDTTLRIWDVFSGRELQALSGHTASVNSVTFNPDGCFFLSGSSDATTKLWRLSDGAELATLASFTDDAWVVTDPEGRFDTADLESMPHLHWVMPDDPFTPVPLEVFMKDYYTPRLLARIMAGEKFPPVRPLMTLNRTQPEVKITSVEPNTSDPSLINVTVTASGATNNYLQGDGSAGGKEIALATAVHDLRLFRDGQVVGYADGKLAEFKGNAFTKTFTVRLPQAKAGQEVVFSAYAFNDDRVKSETVRTTYKAPALKNATTTKGTAYVVTIGVNQHENRAWNLSFAANDARAVAGRVAGDLRKSGRYGNVVSVTLAADGPARDDWRASKAAIRALLARLSGVSTGALPEVLRGVAGVEALRRATPDDTLIIAFAGHGFTDDDGMFYLMPQDTGEGQGKIVTSLLRSRSISSDELSLWLRDIDAGDMTMIVDACHSAASVASEGFKPGPMGSRGLGQLSFDKGMRILAASQSDQYALEDGKLQHGLLTFSLINDGLDAFNADHEPKDKTIYLDEWLKYGVKRVPTLWEEVKTGKVVVVNRAAQPIVLNAEGDAVASNQPARQQAQTPALFDFAKRRQGIELARAGDAK